ncbi:MAG TPA: hypothetical protein VKN18_31295 [Blastocatellia bacterium]|nr:hypothetical protein [Blastocatellia bacterium]
MHKRKMIWGREAAPRERGIVEDPTNLEPDAFARLGAGCSFDFNSG